MNILILGKNGQLGFELEKLFNEQHAFNVTALARADVDITDKEAVKKVFEQNQPDIIFNATAYTAVDKAEEEPEVAKAINADALAYIADAASALEKKSPWIVHFSTDYVFNGQSSAPFKETDKVEPLGVYGATKLEGEQNLLNDYAQSLVFRISWVYSYRANNFVKTMLRLTETRDELNVVDDQHGCPNYAPDLAKAMLPVIDAISNNKAIAGVYHLTSNEQTTWCGFARAIMQQAGKSCVVHAIPSSEFPTPAQRPEYSVMDSHKFEQQFAYSLPDYSDALARCLQAIKSLDKTS